MSTNRAQSKAERKRKLNNRRRRIQYRLRDRHWSDQPHPMFTSSNIRYELADRVGGLGPGGIGAMHLLARRTGLVEALDRRLHLLKVHLPYHESDHVLNIAYNILAGGTCLEDIELRRNDEVYLDALEAQRIPDPTTAGDFCRRFDQADIEILMNTINNVRVKVWQQQPASFFEEAIIEGDGLMAETTGQCKQGMDINYKGQWGYHPLLISLANTAEPLYLVNRRGNRPSHEGAGVRFDQSIALCKRAGFKKVLLRGDTDFTQTKHLDGWDDDGVRFVFGIDAMANLVEKAANLPQTAWKPLERPATYEVQTQPRGRPTHVQEQPVRAPEFEKIRPPSEQAAAVASPPPPFAPLTPRAGRVKSEFRIFLTYLPGPNQDFLLPCGRSGRRRGFEVTAGTGIGRGRNGKDAVRKNLGFPRSGRGVRQGDPLHRQSPHP